MAKYRWESAQEWLQHRILNGGEDELRAMFVSIVNDLDSDFIQDAFEDMMSSDGYFGRTFEYHINLDERGEFRADVRDPETQKSLYEIAIDSSDEDGGNIFEDGYMRDKSDVDGLREYLVELGILEDDDELIAA